MQSSLSKLLVNEHNIIQDAGEGILLLNFVWKDDPLKYEQTVKKLIEFFSTYADKYHHNKEEEILFPELSKKNEAVCGGIVDELIHHHEFFRNTLQNIKGLLDEKDYESVQKNFEEYIDTLNSHIAMENDEVFPMADGLFNDDELDKLYYRCIDKDNALGISKKEILEDLIKKFKTETDESVKLSS